MDFLDKIKAKAKEGKYVCLGLDPVYEKIPMSVPGRRNTPHPTRMEKAIVFYNFCVSIVDATHDQVAAFKPNCAFFEALGWEGSLMLELLIQYIHRVAPDVAVDLDAKRADIGKTNEGYAVMAFDICEADAVTVNPYFGEESLRPFLDREGKGVIVLCRTSNPGAEEIQDRLVLVSQEEAEEFGLEPGVDHIPLYQYVAYRVARWSSNGHIAVVAPATYPEQLGEIREILPMTIILIPGVGVQGGDLVQAVIKGSNKDFSLFQLNAGSKVLFAGDGDDFALQAWEAIILMNQNILQALSDKARHV